MAIRPITTDLQYPVDASGYAGTVSFQVVQPQPVTVSLVRSGDDTQAVVTGLGDRPSPVISQTCKLYLPSAIAISDQVEYTNVDLGVIGAATERGLSAGQGLINSGAAAVGKSISSFVEALTNPTTANDAGRLLANRIASSVAGEGVGGAVRSATRVTTNPNTRALFQSVQLREFAFSFTMIPTTALEARTIEEIIYFFRQELYPETIPAGSTGPNGENAVKVGYRFPNRFRIFFDYNTAIGPPIPVATQLLDSYLYGFNAVYNPGSMGMHSDGKFAQYDISMQFREFRTLERRDIMEEGR